MEIVVVLPAPLPPSRATVSPRFTVKPMPSTAATSRKCLHHGFDEDDFGSGLGRGLGHGSTRIFSFMRQLAALS